MLKTKIPIYSEKERKILHLLVGHSCNNNCVFCFEDDRASRYNYIKSQKPEIIQKMLLLNKNASEVLFTCGEPTLSSQLLTYVTLAKKLGIKTISIISNGRKFIYKEYAEKLLKTGVNSITISIHAPNAKLHNALVRTKNSFAETLLGIKNLCELKNKYPLKLQTSTVVNTKNYKYLMDIYAILTPYLVDKIIFNMMMPEGRGEKYFSNLMPQFKDVVQEINFLVHKIPPKELKKIILVDFPYCVTENLPDIIRGHIEKFIQYEPLNATGHKKINKKNLEKRFNKFNKNEKNENESVLTGFYITSRQLKEKYFRIKRKECFSCKYNNICPGIWKSYIDNFGWDEFIAVKNN